MAQLLYVSPSRHPAARFQAAGTVPRGLHTSSTLAWSERRSARGRRKREEAERSGAQEISGIKVHLRQLMVRIRGQLWLVPALYGSIALGMALLTLCPLEPDKAGKIWWAAIGQGGRKAKEALAEVTIANLVKMSCLQR